MKFIIKKTQIIQSLQYIVNLLGSRTILPIYNYLLIEVKKDQLTITYTNIDIELIVNIPLNSAYQIGISTIPIRKFYNIIRNFSTTQDIIISLHQTSIVIHSEKSKYILSTFPTTEFPNIKFFTNKLEFYISSDSMKILLETTQFSMANQDIRYFLNGMLFDIQNNNLSSVSTDGHRLSICTIPIKDIIPNFSIIIPRKSIENIAYIINKEKYPIKIQIGINNLRLYVNNYIFTTKLIEGSFPDYKKILPSNFINILKIHSNILKIALTRISVLSNNKKINIARFSLTINTLKITSENTDKENAEEIIPVIYQGNNLEIGFNINYLLDILNILKNQIITLKLNNNITSIKIEENIKNCNIIFIIMPIRL